MTRNDGMGRRRSLIRLTSLIALFSALTVGVLPGMNRVVARPGGGPTFGDPLSGLTPQQLQRFHDGKEAFEETEGVGDGIGPVFNDVSCAACHNGQASGGGNAVLSTRIGAIVNGRFDALVNVGGPTIQRQGIIGLNGFQFVGEIIPPQATIVARRRAPQLFGLGLVDAVDDDTYWDLALIQHLFFHETAGRPNLVRDLRTGNRVVGKFGWKAQIGSVFDFSADAYKDEMGITTPGFIRTDDGRKIDEENAPQGNVALLAFNPVATPNEPDTEDIDLFTDFITFLAPPPRSEITAAARVGEVVFRQIGCASCHVPTLRTGRNVIRALDRVTFHPYSDFLLHDMGTLGDGIEDGTGQGHHMRTAPLWGLRTQPAFLHDGRAATIEQAILHHAGQGAHARQRFVDLPVGRKQALLAFLNSL